MEGGCNTVQRFTFYIITQDAIQYYIMLHYVILYIVTRLRSSWFAAVVESGDAAVSMEGYSFGCAGMKLRGVSATVINMSTAIVHFFKSFPASRIVFWGFVLPGEASLRCVWCIVIYMAHSYSNNKSRKICLCVCLCHLFTDIK